ncbi:MAG: sugar transferase [Clostridia bacterium]|nr:sugar transferase [Clostridia bacterium]
MHGVKLLHFVVTVALFIVCWILYYRNKYTEDFFHLKGDILMYAVYGLTVALMYRIYDAYNLGFQSEIDTVYAITLADAITAIISYVMSALMYMRITNPLPLFAMGLVQFAWNILWTVMAYRVYKHLHRASGKGRKTVVIYRNEEDLARLEEVIQMEGKFDVVKYIQDPADDYWSLEKELEGFEAVLVSGVNATLRNGIAKYCIDRNIRGYFAPHVGDIIMQGAFYMRCFSVPVMSVRRAEPTPEYLVTKRLFDVFVSGLALIILSPVFLVTALAIKLYDGGPVLYKQTRLTKNGRKFKILKFRSMRTDAERDGVARLASEHDDRITPVGKFIRACRLDELPQLINILRGEMSLVGPRPERPEIAAEYEKEIPAFSLRLQAKAGLTGLAQVYGKYNSTPYDKLQMDLMYINKMSVTEDLRLLFATIRILFLKDSTEGIDEGKTTASGKKMKPESEKRVNV